MVCWDGNSSKSQRLCANLCGLVRRNESVCRERHPLPVVEQVLAQLTVTKLFSKLDANSGFRQIPLSPESAYSQHLSHHLGGSVFIGFHCPRTFSKTDALNSLRCRGSAVHDG